MFINGLAALGRAGLPAVLLLLTYSGTANGQSADDRESRRSEPFLEKITVTARRRQESLQDVPVAVTALTAQALERRQILDTTDLDRVTPSMQFTSYGQLSGNNSAAVVFIRGVGQLDPTPAVDPGVGIYVDDVYMGRSVGGAMEFFDTADIQVLRGPQGTLFGRNTIGGAVLISTVLPGDELEGQLRATVGDDSLWELFGAATIPLSENAALRLAAGAKQRDGYVIRSFDGQDLGNDDVTSLRATLRWEMTDDLQAIVRADHSEEDENGSPFVFKGINTTAPVPAISSVGAGCPGATIPFAPVAPGDPRFGAPFVPEIDDPRCANNFWNLGPRTNGGTAPVESTFEANGASLTLNWQPGERFALHSISAWRDTEWTGIRDADNTPFVILTTDYTSHSEQLSQELRLDYTAERLSGVVGAYWFDEETVDRVSVPLNFPPAPPVIASVLAGGPGSRDLQHVNLATESIALFTEWTFDLNDAWSISGGVRWTEDDKAMRATVLNVFPETLPDPDPLPDTAIPDGGPLYIFPDRFEDTYEKATYSASTQYRFNDNTMAYASYSTSFKSGGFNQRYNAPPPGFLPVTFDEETVETLEFGFKSDLSQSLRLNAAVYFSDYEDIQLIYRIGPVPLLFNAGTASINGAELEFQFVPNDSLFVEGGFSFLDDTIDAITEVPGATATIGPENTLPFTPEWQGNLGIGYTFFLANDWTLTPRLDTSYTGEQYFDAGNTEITAQSNSVTVADFGLVLAGDDERWSVGLFVDNLTDELYPLQGNASLATLGYAEMVYARGRNWYVTANLEF